MKKYILTISLCITVLFSCENQLETFPASSVAAEQAFRNEGDFTNAIRGMYLAMLDGNYYGGELEGYDVLTDNLIISREGRLSQQFRYEWAYDPNTGFGTYLADVYEVIQNANFILDNIDVLEDGDFKDNAMGEALGVRALAHFDVIRYFAEIPTQSASSGASLGMPYVTEPDVNSLPSRISVDEYYQMLVDDLTLASSLINETNVDSSQMGKDAVNGILAKVYLYMGRWQDAVNAANKVTESVSSRSNYTGIWNDSSTDGVIFRLENDNTTRITLGVPYNQTAGGIKSEYVPDYEFFLMYGDDDIRKTAFFETSEFGGLLYNHVIKWYSSVSTTALGVVDAKILRAAEVYLTKAEALAELGQDTQARAALDAVRSQRYSDFVSGGEIGNSLKEAIKTERRLELAFEGTRFSDIKRYGEAVTRSEFGHLADGTGVPADERVLPVGDFHFQVPIPIGELNLNPNIVQNPGYGG